MAENAKRVFFGDKSFHVFNEVYEPAEDTFLLAENLQVKPDDVILEIGTGCGILSVLAAFQAKWVVAVDINPYAVRCAKVNVRDHDVSEKIDILRGDLFGPLREDGTFDLILFNAPYLPTENESETWIDYAWTGGRSGRKIIDRFLLSVFNYLKHGGRILLVQSTLSDVDETLKALRNRGFNVKILAECKVTFETITLIEAVKPQRNLDKS